MSRCNDSHSHTRNCLIIEKASRMRHIPIIRCIFIMLTICIARSELTKKYFLLFYVSLLRVNTRLIS